MGGSGGTLGGRRPRGSSSSDRKSPPTGARMFVSRHGGKYTVRLRSTILLGTHDTQAEAIEQMRELSRLRWVTVPDDRVLGECWVTAPDDRVAEINADSTPIPPTPREPWCPRCGGEIRPLQTVCTKCQLKDFEGQK